MDGTNIAKVNKNQANLLREIRLKLLKENPLTYGERYETIKRKPLSYFKSWIERSSNPDTGIFLIFKGREVIGMREIRRYNKDPKIGYFGNSGILKEYQNQGVGKNLQDFTFGWIKKNTNFKKIVIIVRKHNKKYLKFAKRYGFKIFEEGKYRGIPEFYLEKTIIK
ncbi:GNAT family N-acetyltransferase [Patescibacteria group bacterium]|nr:GNAT family N-acetyltransferase [Patescibacteria group bacterium]MBU1868013.1 GNAT family N-acetyltransferase [Patescibacteria group bacterium]